MAGADSGAPGPAGDRPGGPRPETGRAVPGRLCARRKSEAAIRRSQHAIRQHARQQGYRLNPETLVANEYIILFTTFPADRFPVAAVLEWYRIRWQIELVFKRFKHLAGLGHLPKYDPASARAWLYGKLLTCLLTEKLILHAHAISPWGSEVAPAEEPVAGVPLHAAPSHPRRGPG